MSKYPPLPREITLLSGDQFDPWNPQGEMLTPSVIARTLSRICRWNAQCETYYSVAQHCCLVHDYVPAWLRLPALLHDTHEGFSGFGDVPSPIKQQVDLIKLIEGRIDRAIALTYMFDHTLFDHALVQVADMAMLAAEIRDLMPKNGHVWPSLPEPPEERIEPWTMEVAEQQMLDRLVAITTNALSSTGTSCLRTTSRT